MTPQELAKVAAKFGVSKDVAALSLDDPGAAQRPQPVATEAKRIRQDSAKLNKLESDWLTYLQVLHHANKVTFRPQALRFRLGNGAWYKPDITGFVDGKLTAWECKGPKQVKGVAKGLMTVKVAASAWPEVEFWLVWRERGEWQVQRVLA